MVNLDGAVANAGSDAEICFSDSVYLSCNIGSTGETYKWTSIPVDAGLSAQFTNQTIKISPLTDTKYYVEVTDACDYNATDSVNVVVFDLPVANAGNNGDICLGSSYNLEALSGGVHYQWGSIPNDPSLLVNQQDTTRNPIVTPDVETNYRYYVEVTNQNGCTATDTMELIVNHVPDIQLSPDADTICFGNSVTLTAMGDIADSYAWTADPYDGTIVNINQNSITVTPDTSTTYYLTATVGGINCPATPIKQIIVIPQLTTTFEISNNKIQTCENEAVGIYYTGNASVNAVYSWNFDNNSIINSGSGFASDPYSIQWTSVGSKTISLSLTENECPSDTSTIDVTVFATPVSDFSAMPESGCAALEVSFTNLSTNLDNPQYEWNIEGTTVSNFEPIHTFENAGTYSVSLKTINQNICSSTEVKTNQITVFQLPETNFEATPIETIVDDGVINFTNNTTSQDITTYSWYFGDGDSSTVANPMHKYNAEGVYTVLLVATTLSGCQQSFNSDIIVHPNFSVYPPNAFTPNGDGENDKFEVKGVGISSYSIRIFSRWGELVFESKNIEDSWDGTYKGNLVTTGTYVYKINYRSMLGNEYVINGTVTVVR
jgi:gliding motility-associated-like protein